MAGVCDVISVFDKFELHLIEKQWSDDIWSSEFSSCPDDLPEEFSDKFSPLSYCDIAQVIEEADKIVHLWLNTAFDISNISNDGDSSNSCTSGAPSWTQLQEINYKQLLALIYYYTCTGQMNNQDNNLVHTCIKASNFYFTLLIIPGSDVYKIFQMNLFEKCLESLSLHKYLEIATGRKIKKTKSSKKNEDMSSDDEYLEMDETLTLSQQQNVVKQLNFLMSTFQHFVQKFSFKKYPEALSMSMAVLADLSRLERNSNLQDFSVNNTATSFIPLSRNAYLTMKELCSPFHGRVSEIVRLVLFHIMPNLTSIGGLANAEINKFNQKELTNIRNIAISFIIENVIPLGSDAQLGLKILIQQLCYNMIDRADYRSKATDMVLAILCKLPSELYYTLLKWIFRMSMMEGAHHRVISLEILSKLIYMKPDSGEISKLTESQFQHIESQMQNSDSLTKTKSELHKTDKTDYTSSLSQEPIVSFSQPVNYVPLEYRRAMLAVIIDRIRDEAAIVRTRALSILSDVILNRTSQCLQLILRDVFLRPYLELNEINLTGHCEENEFFKLKTFMSLLDKIQDSEVTKHMFPGGRVIVKKVFEKCLDERVNVRKAALQVITSLFKFSSKWMTSEALELFGKHCRDPAMSIRKDMSNSITELMLLFPDEKILMELWVEEVVPLIMDREIKVQEQILQIFSNIILSKVKSFSSVSNNIDQLPWKLLDKIAKQNKRSFFMAACGLWHESGKFNQNLISILKSHIGTINDSPSWVFLACISEYFDIQKPEFVMDYYLDVLSKEVSDVKSSYFALLTLSTSWQKLTKDKKEVLQVELYNKLKSYSVNPTFVTLTVEIVAGLTVFIAEDELSGKKEVAKWGIELIEDCETHLEICLKAPKDKLNKCKHCINVLALLGALIGICPDTVRNPTFSLLFNFLMDASPKNSVLDRKMNAITVITVSKMALQNDLFARSLVAGLAQLLFQSCDPIVLNNVIVAIADIGESYASLIEPVIPFISVCLKSKHQSLKAVTTILLVELLQEDYLKARDILIFHLLTMVNEPDPWLVNIVKYYFTNSLLARNPNKMYQLLLPALFHFNNFTSHPDYPKLDITDAERRAFDLSGPENHFQRINIYKFMLSNVPYMVKMKCLHFICTVILNGAADNIINIKGKNGEQLLFDAFLVLTMPEIKVECNDLVKGKNDEGEEDDDQKQMPLCKLVKQMLTAVQKKEIIETIIPICCKLKKKLLLDNKKLLPYLRKFIRELVKDYKSEFNEIFKEDKQFGIEILHELDSSMNTETNEKDNQEELIQDMIGKNKSSDKVPESDVADIEMANELENLNKSKSLSSVLEKSLKNNVEKENSKITEPENMARNEAIQTISKSLGELEENCLQSGPKTSQDDIKNHKVPSNFESSHRNAKKRASLCELNETNGVKAKKVNQSNSEELFSCKDNFENGGKRFVSESLMQLSSKPSKSSENKEKLDSVTLDETNGVNSNKANLNHNEESRKLREKHDDIDRRSLRVSLNRLSSKLISGGDRFMCQATPSGIPGVRAKRVKSHLKKCQEERMNMEKAVENIIIPPPAKIRITNKRQSLVNGKNTSVQSPITPTIGEKKELLTSTPLITVDNPDFGMDLSSVVDETDQG